MNPLEKFNNNLESLSSLIMYSVFLIVFVGVIVAFFYNSIKDYLRDKFDL